MTEYLVYEMKSDTVALSITVLFAKAFIMGLMVFGVITPLVGVALLVVASLVAMVAYKPYREKYKEYQIEFTDR